MEEEKLDKLRQIVRENIMPLVQSIYDEEPEDIESFCTQYFRKRCLNDADVAQYDQGVPKVEDNAGIEHETSRSSLQGSASLPALRKTEDQVNLKVRETSSWNHPPRESQLDSRKHLKFSFLEPPVKIGDEGQTEGKVADLNEFVNADMGDACSRQKDKADAENQGRPTVADSFTVASAHLTSSCHTPYKAPSAPLLELNREHFSNVPPQISDDGTRCSQNTMKTDASMLLKYQSAREGFDTEKHSNGQSLVESPGDSKCPGQLSPNSSLGFIPTVSGDSYEGQETSSTDKSDSIKIDVDVPSDMPRLDGDRRMLQDEIIATSALLEDASDVLSVMVAKLNSLEEMRVSEEKSPEVQDTKKSNSAKKKVSFSKEIKETVLPADDYEDGVSSHSADSNFGNDVTEEAIAMHDTGFLHVDEEFGDEASKDRIDACPRRERDPRMIRMRQIMDDDSRSDNETRDDAADNCCPRYNMDETWIRNWYAVHPRLDNIEPSFANGEELKSTVVGESGDQPTNIRRGCRRGSCYGRGSRTGSSSESRLATYVSPPYPSKDYKQASFPADEIHPRSGSGRVACNFSFKDSKADAKMMKFSRPYSWDEWAASRFQQARSRDSNPEARSSEEANSNVSLAGNCTEDPETADQDRDDATTAKEVVVGDSSYHPIKSRCGDAKPAAHEDSISDNSYLDDTFEFSANGADTTIDVSSDIGSPIACSATVCEAIPEPAPKSSPRDHAISQNGELEANSMVESIRVIQLNGSVEGGIGQAVVDPEQAPGGVFAGPEKMEPGLDSAGGDFAEGAAGIEGGPALQEPPAEQVIAPDLPRTAPDVAERPNPDSVTVENFKESMQDIKKEEEEIFSSEFRVLDLQMCSDSEASDSESTSGVEDSGK